MLLCIDKKKLMIGQKYLKLLKKILKKNLIRLLLKLLNPLEKKYNYH